MAESVTPSNPLANSISLNGEEINQSVPTIPTTDTGIVPTHTTTITNQPVTDENGSNETVVTKKRKKTSPIWDDFDQVESSEGTKAICKYCKSDMWRSSHQIVEYMVITGHFIDAGWNLQKRVLSFVQVPAPRRGIDVADAIFKCLKTWGIENKVFSVSVDNASYNDSCLRALKDTISDNNSLPVGGSLFHVRCCAHILNLLVQDGLGKIKGIIHKVRESVKYVNFNDSRFKTFVEIAENKRLKEKKLIIDCPTRWNSTYNMLSVALKFKSVFPVYKEREPHYNYEPSSEDWRKVEKICKFLKVFNLATHVISGSEYPTANLYLPEVWRVKQVIDDAIEDRDSFMREMATSMKEKFDKYWGECNMVMSLACVLDPRCKLHVIKFCFPLIYKPEHVAAENIEKVKNTLQEMYDEYAEKYHGETIISGVNTNSLVASSNVVSSEISGIDEMLNMVREKRSHSSNKIRIRSLSL
ncbi:zinc finger BED domain-containing protein RICESLEEPER 2-like [Arachis duranensis]|uniref:Zinc finger BED domain-containing protein RICESLEEPER 2-like n=1 Tax=Arachis duranensis TaxID=130453 RepID=A0A6P4DIV0_ARADU|nr:zinc finger BED domain-containing protein RICESLEEPER 2-like [Arachis duranensis]